MSVAPIAGVTINIAPAAVIPKQEVAINALLTARRAVSISLNVFEGPMDFTSGETLRDAVWVVPRKILSVISANRAKDVATAGMFRPVWFAVERTFPFGATGDDPVRKVAIVEDVASPYCSKRMKTSHKKAITSLNRHRPSKRRTAPLISRIFTDWFASC